MYDDEDTKSEEEIYSEADDIEEDEAIDEKKDEELVVKEIEIIFDDFRVRSSQGVSINGVNFCRGKYRLGQLVGTMIITEDIRDNILSLDAQSIVTNPHLAV